MNGQLLREASAERAIGPLNGASPGQETRYVFAAKDAMLPPSEASGESLAVLGRQSGTRPQARKKVLELGRYGFHVPERDAGSHEGHELAIVVLLEALREGDRVGGTPHCHVATVANGIERGLEGELARAQSTAHGGPDEDALAGMRAARFSAARRAPCA